MNLRNASSSHAKADRRERGGGVRKKNLCANFLKLLTQQEKSILEISSELGIKPSLLLLWSQTNGTNYSSPYYYQPIEFLVEKWIHLHTEPKEKAERQEEICDSLLPSFTPMQFFLLQRQQLHAKKVVKEKMKSQRNTNQEHLAYSIYTSDTLPLSLRIIPPVNHCSKKRKREPIPHNILSYSQNLKPLPKFVQDDFLVPIRIDVDIEGTRYRDSFTWNLRESDISPEYFATITTHDMNLGSRMTRAISESLTRQLKSYKSYRCTNNSFAKVSHPICIDIRINDVILHDRFEWDIHSKSYSPERFAKVTCQDLGLPSYFELHIAMSIREQIYLYKSAILNLSKDNYSGVIDRTQFETESNSSTKSFWAMPPVEFVTRSESDSDIYRPKLSRLTMNEMNVLDRKRVTTYRPYSLPSVVQNPNKASMQYDPSPESTNIREEKRYKSVNSFWMYCHLNRPALINSSDVKRSAVELRKLLAEEWKHVGELERDRYNELAENENERRRRMSITEDRDKLISFWEDTEVRRKGIVSTEVLDVSNEQCRKLFLEDYMAQRHNVGTNQAKSPKNENLFA